MKLRTLIFAAACLTPSLTIAAPAPGTAGYCAFGYPLPWQGNGYAYIYKKPNAAWGLMYFTQCNSCADAVSTNRGPGSQGACTPSGSPEWNCKALEGEYDNDNEARVATILNACALLGEKACECDGPAGQRLFEPTPMNQQGDVQ